MAWEFIVRLRDDLDGSEADETITFGWKDRWYTVDLTGRHAEEFEDAMSPYLKVARLTDEPGAPPTEVQGGQGMGARRFKAAARAWGNVNGWPDVKAGQYHPRAMIQAFEEHLKAQSGAV